ncbi:MAG TPA: MOSC domain-containing protein [Ramlibacter sp.]|nr:MOSC domain-containing protein [Ramlibacter sp.]
MHEALPGWIGEVLFIHIAPAGSFEMQEVPSAHAIAGKGLEGDRYFLGSGTYSRLPAVREVTLFEMEVLQALARNDPPLQEGPIQLEPSEHRRNLTVRGVPLHHLSGGGRFAVGPEVILQGANINFPCRYLEGLLDKPVRMPLYNRGGLNCRIERGGVIRVGDAIRPL